RASRSSTSKNPACFIAPFLQPEPEKWNHSVGLNTKRFLEPSTFNPPDWDFSSPYDGVPGVTDIAVRAVHYASAHNFLPGLCELSITKNTASWRNLRSIP
ncbi:hypothetical protein KTQ54_16795, partial [Komagataeibacter oboediens]|uniref:hypothetical protein n=1 Tax=Komagataeibacter oboediens TaxID=65958 RepID=UPI001C2BC05B